jgi:aromatic-L-amino-acid decarboxylase
VLRDAFTLVPEYLRTAHDDDTSVINLNDYGTSLGRRFRALKLWMVMRAFGAQGLAERIREHVRLAALLTEWVDATPGWERTAPARLSTVCLRAHPPGIDDEAALGALNQRVMERVNAAGRHLISHTSLRGRITLHVAIGNLRTQERHVRNLWADLRAALAAELAA